MIRRRWQLAYAPNMPLRSVMRCMMGIRPTVARKPMALMMALAMSEYRACEQAHCDAHAPSCLLYGG